MTRSNRQRGGAASPGEDEAPTWYWKLDFALLREAAAIRRRDPREFRGAVLTYFGFGGRDDGTIISRMRSHPEGRRLVADRIPLPPGILEPGRLPDLLAGLSSRQAISAAAGGGLDPVSRPSDRRGPGESRSRASAALSGISHG